MIIRRGRMPRSRKPDPRFAPVIGLLLLSASCVHDRAELRASTSHPVPAAASLASLPVATDAEAIQPMSADAAVEANASLPISDLTDTSARPLVLRGGSPLDQLRSLDCLSQAVFYEARSESEDGQRAVAQVVLNRVHHPAFPASVCGVVYQGPMRAGGGCQFTFTCDGSLALPPSGEAWERARRIAAEALAGYVYAPVGHATHYHTTSVFPLWAPTLIKSALIGRHIFYRLPGSWGSANAFSQAYAGREPLPVPRQIFFKTQPKADTLKARLAAQPISAADEIVAPDPLPKMRLTQESATLSRVRPEYARSGTWRGAAPGTAAPAGEDVRPAS